MEQTTEKKVLLDCRDVSLGYEGKAIWEGLTFQVRSGDYLCIVGENGSGKSTLLKSLLGLLRPMKGDIVLDASLRAGAIGYLPQQTRLAIIMVTHDLRSALPYATAILHAGHGSWFYGDTASYLASPYGKRFGGDGI